MWGVTGEQNQLSPPSGNSSENEAPQWIHTEKAFPQHLLCARHRAPRAWPLPEDQRVGRTEDHLPPGPECILFLGSLDAWTNGLKVGNACLKVGSCRVKLEPLHALAGKLSIPMTSQAPLPLAEGPWHGVLIAHSSPLQSHSCDHQTQSVRGSPEVTEVTLFWLPRPSTDARTCLPQLSAFAWAVPTTTILFPAFLKGTNVSAQCHLLTWVLSGHPPQQCPPCPLPPQQLCSPCEAPPES